MIGERRGQRFMSDINVVPLVDVVLVLLVVFMVTAPMLYRGIDVNLPRSRSNTIKPSERVILSVRQDRMVYINDERVPLDRLEKALEELKVSSPEMAIYLQGDENVAYGIVIQVMDVIKRVGISQVGMVTEPVQDL